MKNPWAMSDREEALARMDEFVEEADGWMRLYLIRYDNTELHDACKRRDPLAITLAKTIAAALDKMPGRPPRRCTSCEHVFGRDTPHAFVVWVPNNHDDQPENLMAQPVCAPCCAEKGDKQLMEDALLFIKTIFPSMEEVEEDLIDGHER